MSEKKSMPWYVVFEIRDRGAIGRYDQRGMSVTADSKESAVTQVQQVFSAKGYETGFPVKVFQYEENEQ